MAKIAVIGGLESVQGFAALGLDIYPVSHADEAGPLLRRLAEGDYGVIYLTEELYAALDKEVNRLKEAPLPAVIPLPGITGTMGAGLQRLRLAVERAVGSNILES